LSLVLRLAEDFIKGFRVKGSKIGRPRGTTKVGGFELVKEIDALILEKKRTVSDACQTLTQKKRSMVRLKRGFLGNAILRMVQKCEGSLQTSQRRWLNCQNGSLANAESRQRQLKAPALRN